MKDKKVKEYLSPNSKESEEKSIDNSSTKKKIRKKRKKRETKSNFLTTTYHMIEEEDRNGNGVIKWGANGNSFTIENTEEFLKILPKYFKTKNYSSFVRQLNMYDFHKIKNLDGFHEFKHPLFKKGNLEKLGSIKRKINEYNDIIDQFKGDKKIIINEYHKLKKNYDDIEESLIIIANQNKRLVESNKDLVCQLYFFKKEYEIRMRKLLFLFFVLIKNYTPDLIKLIQNSLDSSSLISQNELENNSTNMNSYINTISNKLLFNQENSEIWLNKLFELFTNYLNTQPIDVNNREEEIDWRKIMESLNVEDQHNLSNINSLKTNFGNANDYIPNTTTFNNGNGRNSHAINMEDNDNLNSEKQSLFKDSMIDFKSQMSNRSQNSEVNDNDILEIVQNKLGKDSDIENMSENDEGSLNLFSPKSERKDFFNF
jgi:hypothetical protein